MLQLASINSREPHTSIFASATNCMAKLPSVRMLHHRGFVKERGSALRWIPTISTLRSYHLGLKEVNGAGAGPRYI